MNHRRGFDLPPWKQLLFKFISLSLFRRVLSLALRARHIAVPSLHNQSARGVCQRRRFSLKVGREQMKKVTRY